MPSKAELSDLRSAYVFFGSEAACELLFRTQASILFPDQSVD